MKIGKHEVQISGTDKNLLSATHKRVDFLTKPLSSLGLLYFFQAEDGIRDWSVTGVQTCALPISSRRRHTGLVSDWSSDVCSSDRSEEHTSELQSLTNLVCRLLLEIGRGSGREKGEGQGDIYFEEAAYREYNL